jgi:hypothetical protein
MIGASCCHGSERFRAVGIFSLAAALPSDIFLLCNPAERPGEVTFWVTIVEAMAIVAHFFWVTVAKGKGSRLWRTTTMTEILEPANGQKLTTSQLARRYQVTPRTIQNWRDLEKIPFIRINPRCIRYDAEAVDRALENK